MLLVFWEITRSDITNAHLTQLEKKQSFEEARTLVSKEIATHRITF